jgi:hypothetical protein
MPHPSTACGRTTPKRPYGRFGGGPPAGRAAFGRLLPPWIPHAVRAWHLGAAQRQKAEGFLVRQPVGGASVAFRTLVGCVVHGIARRTRGQRRAQHLEHRGAGPAGHIRAQADFHAVVEEPQDITDAWRW